MRERGGEGGRYYDVGWNLGKSRKENRITSLFVWHSVVERENEMKTRVGCHREEKAVGGTGFNSDTTAIETGCSPFFKRMSSGVC